MFVLDVALKALEGRKEFAVNRYDGLVSINYLISLPDSFEGIRREFRGITFDEQTGKIVSLPFHKFHNINEKPETQWDKIRDLSGVVYEKVDGSLIHFFIHKGELRAATRMGAETIQAKEALALAITLPGMVDYLVGSIKAGFTPIFEYVSPTNQIVVEYPEPALVYLHSRSLFDGSYIRSYTLTHRRCAQQLDIDFVSIVNYLDRQNFEGYVCVLENGLWVKVKCPWYLERHRVVDLFMRPMWCMYEVALDNMLDDAIARAPDKRKDMLRSVQAEVSADILAELTSIQVATWKISFASQRDCDDEREQRKRFAMRAQLYHYDIFSLLMTAYDKKDLEPGIKKRLLERYKEKYPKKLFEIT